MLANHAQTFPVTRRNRSEHALEGFQVSEAWKVRRYHFEPIAYSCPFLRRIATQNSTNFVSDALNLHRSRRLPLAEQFQSSEEREIVIESAWR